MMKDDQKNVFDFKTLQQGYQPGDTDKMIANMIELMPALRSILDASSLEEQLTVIRQTFVPKDYEHLLMQIVIIEYFYQAKDKRLDKALALAELNYQLAKMLPPQWDLKEGFGLSPARHIADALGSLGSIYNDLGNLSQTLEYYQQAEEWYSSDELERNQRGITGKSEYDRLFHERDIRAVLFENMARLYGKLGDRDKAAEYARRMNEIDRYFSTAQTRIAMLLRYGEAAGEHGDVNSALQSFYEALDLAIADKGNQISPREVVTVCHSIGDALAHLKLFRQALRYHQRALELNRQTGHLERMSYDYRSIGRIFEARPDLGDALQQYQEALGCASITATDGTLFIWSASDGTKLRVIDPDLAWAPSLSLGRMYSQRQLYNQADEFFALAIDLGEIIRSSVVQDEYRIGFQATRLQAYDAMIKMHGQLAIQGLTSGNTIRGHAVRAWRYVERARSRAFLDLLSRSPIHPPDEIPVSFLNKETALIERIRSLSQVSHTDSVEQKRTKWDEYEDTRVKLENVWQNMLAIAPLSIGYVELRRGQPLEVKTLHELLRVE